MRSARRGVNVGDGEFIPADVVEAMIAHGAVFLSGNRRLEPVEVRSLARSGRAPALTLAGIEARSGGPPPPVSLPALWRRPRHWFV